MISRERLVVTVGVVLLAGGLLLLWLPVFLGVYDSYGMQIKCGNGYHGQLLQATSGDQQSIQQSVPDGAPWAVQPVTGYVAQCKSAVAQRRAWAATMVAFGAMTLTVEVMAWAHRRATQPNSSASTDIWAEAPDDYMHEAANLDRRGRPYRERPAGTTL